MAALRALSALRVPDRARGPLRLAWYLGLAVLVTEWESRYDEGLWALQLAAGLAEQLADDSLRATVEVRRSKVLTLRGDYEAARAAAREAIERLSARAGDNIVELGQAHYQLGSAEYSLGLLDEAEASLARTEALWRGRYGPLHPNSISVLNARALNAGGREDWNRANELFTEQLRRSEELFGDEHLDVSDALSNLGVAQLRTRKYAAARESFERALAIREREMGPENLYVGHTLANLAPVYARLGDGERAWA